MDDMNKWVDLLKGVLPDKETEPLLREGVAKLQAFLESEPRAEQHILNILERCLGGEISADTYNHLNNSLDQYFGYDLTNLLYWVVWVENPSGNRMVELEKFASPKVMSFLRTAVGVYGVDLSKAFNLWNRLPDAWKDFYRDVYYDNINQRYHVRVRIEKFNGEKTVIEGNPDTILELTNAFITTLYIVGNRESFSPANITQFQKEVANVNKMFAPPKKKKSA
jgi:hypothetical protein